MLMAEWLDLFSEAVIYLPYYRSLDDKAYDYSGKENHAVVTGASRVAGVFDEAISFDGLNDYYAVPHHPTLNTPDAFTLCTWGADGIIFQKGLSTDRGFLFQRHAVTDEIRVYLAKSNPAAWDWNRRSSITVPDANWHYYVARFNETNLDILIDNNLRNGVLTGVAPFSMRTNARAFEAGRDQQPLGTYRQSYMDETMFFPSYLSNAKLTQLFNRKAAV